MVHLNERLEALLGRRLDGRFPACTRERISDHGPHRTRHPLALRAAGHELILAGDGKHGRDGVIAESTSARRLVTDVAGERPLADGAREKLACGMCLVQAELDLG